MAEHQKAPMVQNDTEPDSGPAFTVPESGRSTSGWAAVGFWTGIALLSVVLFVAGFVQCWARSQVVILRHRHEEARQLREVLLEERWHLEIQREALRDLALLAKLAARDLGMKPPRREQVLVVVEPTKVASRLALSRVPTATVAAHR